MLSQGLEAWREVAAVYQRESAETTLHQGEDLCDNRNKKLCNRMQKPTDKPKVLCNRIFQCIAIECHIQDEANTAIFGVDLVKSSHYHNDGNIALSDVVLGDGNGANAAADCGRDGPPVADIEYIDCRNEASDENEEVVAANIGVNVMIAGEGAAVGCPCSQLLSAFGSDGCSM